MKIDSESKSMFSNESVIILSNLVKSYSNDFELGGKIRKSFPHDTLVKAIGNDASLGKEVRKILLNFQK